MRHRLSRLHCNHMVFLPSAAVALRRCLYEVPPVQAGSSRQKAPAANPVRDFLCLAHFAACLDVGHGARRQSLQRLDCILFARTMGSVCRDCQIFENLLEQPSVSGDAGCGFAGDDDDACRVRFQEVRVLPENPPARGIGPNQQMRGRHGLVPTVTMRFNPRVHRIIVDHVHAGQVARPCHVG